MAPAASRPGAGLAGRRRPGNLAQPYRSAGTASRRLTRVRRVPRQFPIREGRAPHLHRRGPEPPPRGGGRRRASITNAPRARTTA